MGQVSPTEVISAELGGLLDFEKSEYT